MQPHPTPTLPRASLAPSTIRRALAALDRMPRSTSSAAPRKFSWEGK